MPSGQAPTQLSFLSEKGESQGVLLLENNSVQELLRTGLSGSRVHRELAVTHGSAVHVALVT